MTIAGLLSESGGSRSLSVSGDGELVISGTSSYTGGTTVNGGTRELAAASALQSFQTGVTAVAGQAQWRIQTPGAPLVAHTKIAQPRTQQMTRDSGQESPRAGK